ncbi:cytochrome c-type biogenesis protein CcmH precursor [mine drainage metagenome]|uniref:Cytochrome c-type biogenesis protein CcmH n=1 Tax=mine drainage metagenome TaxID=410659 RepID=A0A1J5QJS2_9ZZZZ
MIRTMLVALLLVIPLSAGATAQPMGDDPAVEARLKSLSQDLRCLVCQNQTLADSSAPLAEDLRREIRELIIQGKSDQEITDYLVARYGDFVRYRPPLKPQTVLLWAGPALLLLGGLGGLWLALRHRNTLLPDDNEEGEEA